MVAQPKTLEQPKYRIRRRLFATAGKTFDILTKSGEKELFSELKGFSLNRALNIYPLATEAKEDEPWLSISSDQLLGFNGLFCITDTVQNTTIGYLKRGGMESLTQKSWEIWDAQRNPLGTIYGPHPIVSSISSLIPFVPYSLNAYLGDEPIFKLHRSWNWATENWWITFGENKTSDSQSMRKLIMALSLTLCAIEGA